ncbi:hypothetical protein [Cognatishimia maritima]|uniref:Antibiotic biosynthesis monooxygenase n=1 Tax=Cognatishimia maritima TaxID=870908 RepID=A0A1M5S486_9RHOB|nr:hypothetical protein [Cognatishimia maritima]SHH33265.1 hypothetical protein SAMN04488044_2382 [Cognatishimia maritima]
MFARVTPYKMKPGSQAAATEILNGLKDRIKALPGQHRFINVLNDETGEGYIVAFTDFEEPSPETAEKIKALWGQFSEFLVDTPQPSTYSVVVNWD